MSFYRTMGVNANNHKNTSITLPSETVINTDLLPAFYHTEESSFNYDDYDSRFAFTIIPPWIYSAVNKPGIPLETFISEEKLLSILSKADVDFYFSLQDLIWPLLFNSMDADLGKYVPWFVDGNKNNSNSFPGVFSGIKVKEILYNYFLDSSMVSDTLDSYYLSMRPLDCVINGSNGFGKEVIGVALHRCDAGDNVFEKRANALSEWIDIAGKYVTSASIAKSGLMLSYLDQYKKSRM